MTAPGISILVGDSPGYPAIHSHQSTKATPWSPTPLEPRDSESARRRSPAAHASSNAAPHFLPPPPPSASISPATTISFHQRKGHAWISLSPIISPASRGNRSQTEWPHSSSSRARTNPSTPPQGCRVPQRPRLPLNLLELL